MAQPPFRFYSNFFVNDCHELPSVARAALFSFFEKLAANPYSPDFQGKQERSGENYAAEFSFGYVVYWRLIVNGSGVKRIDVLKVAKVSDLK